MNAYFDTAIIIKLYVQELTSPDAIRFVNEEEAPYLLTPWQEIEVRTAVRLKVFRKEITADVMRASLDAFDEDIRMGRWKAPKYNETQVWTLARELSARHAATLGCRTLDIVHVAAALASGVKNFVTFDARQGEVAKLEGLTVKTR